MNPEDDEDDKLAELLADRLVDLARRPGTYRLAALQIAGLLPPPGEVRRDQVARAYGTTPENVTHITRRALAKMRFRLGVNTIRPVDGHPTASADMRDSLQPSTGQHDSKP